MSNILDYCIDFENEVIMAFELEGKCEVKNYAKYWMADIYEYAHSNKEDLTTDPLYVHFYNKNGYVGVEIIADEIYESLKNFKLFGYYYNITKRHLREVVSEMKYTPMSYLSEEPIAYEKQIGDMNSLYDIDDCLPLPLSSYNLFSYIEEEFTPDQLEYEGLRKSVKEIDNVLTLEYMSVSSKDFTMNIFKILSEFSIRLDKNVEVTSFCIEDKIMLSLSFHMNGIENQRQNRKMVYSNVYVVNIDGFTLVDTIKQFLNDTYYEVIGKAKEKGSDVPAVYGKYAMKDLDLHGLKLSFPEFLSDRMLDVFELQSLNIIKESLLLPGKAVVSSSFGVDSVLVQVLVSKVFPSVDTYHGNTGQSFPEIRIVERELIERGIVDKDRLYVGKYKKSFWSLVDEYGFNLNRKGDRRENAAGKKISVSEKCCNLIKHVPFQESIKNNGWNINFAGLRAQESRARDLAAKRDGPLYFARSWNLFRVNPIIFWSDDMVWKFTKNNDIPYASIYDMILYDDNGKELYKPRIGCYACMLSAKYGYLQWLQKFKPKLYKHIMIDRGLLKLLYNKKFGHKVEVNENGKEYVEDIDMDIDHLFDFVDSRPCFFDDTIAKL